MWFVIFSSRFLSWDQRMGRELRHRLRTTITSVHLILMLPIVVGGGSDVAAYQYSTLLNLKLRTLTLTLYEAFESYQQSRIPFINISTQIPWILPFISSGNIKQRHWIYLVPTLELTSTYSLLRINSIISSIRQRPSSTYRIFALNCVKSECAWHASFS